MTSKSIAQLLSFGISSHLQSFFSIFRPPPGRSSRVTIAAKEQDGILRWLWYRFLWSYLKAKQRISQKSTWYISHQQKQPTSLYSLKERMEVSRMSVWVRKRHNTFMLCCIGKTISGTVHHECTATPTHVDSYRGIMRKRVMEAETPQRSVQEIGKSNQPMFVPGAGSALANTGFSDFTVCICWCYVLYGCLICSL